MVSYKILSKQRSSGYSCLFLLKSFGFYFKVNWAFMQTDTIEEITKI